VKSVHGGSECILKTAQLCAEFGQNVHAVAQKHIEVSPTETSKRCEKSGRSDVGG
jgi:hypothetical protein